MQGFASGDLERDAAAIRLFADAGLELLLAQVWALHACGLLWDYHRLRAGSSHISIY